MMDYAKWNFLASAVYIWYSSIDKKRTSASLRYDLKNLVLKNENLGASHGREIYIFTMSSQILSVESL